MDTPAALPTEPSPAEAPARAVDLLAAELDTIRADLRSDAPAVVVPHVFRAAEREALAAAARRILIHVEGEPVDFAVRPDPGCRRCRGSIAYRERPTGAARGNACPCILRQVTGDCAPPPAAQPERHPEGASPAAPPPATPTPQPADGSGRKAERLARLVAELAAADARHAQAVEALAPQVAEAEGRLSRATERAADLETQAAREGNGAAIWRERAASAAQHAAECEARQREALAGLPAVQAERAAADRALEDLAAQRERIDAAHARRTQADRAAVERLRRRAGLPG